MTVYAQHLAWLHAHPKRPERGNKKGEHQKTQSRMESLGESHPLLKMPKADRVVIDAWSDMGLVDYGGMGKIPLKWSEILAYSTQSKSNLTAWESKQVQRISRVYCSFYQEAENPKCRTPHKLANVKQTIQMIRNSVDEQMDKFDSMF